MGNRKVTFDRFAPPRHIWDKTIVRNHMLGIEFGVEVRQLMPKNWRTLA